MVYINNDTLLHIEYYKQQLKIEWGFAPFHVLLTYNASHRIIHKAYKSGQIKTSSSKKNMH